MLNRLHHTLTRICKHLRSPGIDSEESNPPGWKSIPGLLKGSQIRALVFFTVCIQYDERFNTAGSLYTVRPWAPPYLGLEKAVCVGPLIYTRDEHKALLL